MTRFVKLFEEFAEDYPKHKFVEIPSRTAMNYSSEIFNLDQYGKRQSIKKVEGLANLLMSAWLYAEDDFHRGNFGVACNEQGQLYWARLDFGLSFSNITE